MQTGRSGLRGHTRKNHVVLDPQGLPNQLGLTAGQTHDGQIAATLLDYFGLRTIVLADKAYEANRMRELIKDQGATPNISPKSNRRRSRASANDFIVSAT